VRNIIIIIIIISIIIIIIIIIIIHVAQNKIPRFKVSNLGT